MNIGPTVSVQDLPRKIIVACSPAMQTFYHDTRYLRLPRLVVQEIVIQIFDTFLNNTPQCEERLQNLPNFERLDEFIDLGRDPLARATLRAAVVKLGLWIHEYIKSLDGYATGDFPYMFDKMIGDDVALTRCPY